MKSMGFAGLALIAIAGSATAQTPRQAAKNASPTEERAPKGMCRIWLKGVPASRQPAPTDCAAAVKNCPPTGKVIFGDADTPKNQPKTAPPTPEKSSPMVKPLTGKPPVLTRKPPLR